MPIEPSSAAVTTTVFSTNALRRRLQEDPTRSTSNTASCDRCSSYPFLNRHWARGRRLILLVTVAATIMQNLLVRHVAAFTLRRGSSRLVAFSSRRLDGPRASGRPIPPTLDGGDEVDYIDYDYSSMEDEVESARAERRAVPKAASKFQPKPRPSVRMSFELKDEGERKAPRASGRVSFRFDGDEDDDGSTYSDYDEQDVEDDGQEIILPSHKPVLPSPTASSKGSFKNNAFSFLDNFDPKAGGEAASKASEETIVPMEADPFAMSDQQVQKPIETKAQASSSAKPWSKNKASETKGLQTLQEELKQLEADLIEQNNGVKFNMNSIQQVSKILHGPAGGSTNRSTLEGMAGNNRMAALIIQYRDLKQQITRVQRRQELEKKGIAVHSASSVQLIGADNTTIVTEDEDPLILVDASAYIFRAYYAMPEAHRGDGLPTGALMGFCNMINSLVLNRMLQGEQPRLVLCFDAKKSATFRHEMYPEYKANRPKVAMDLVPQFDLVRQAAKAYGIIGIEADGYEADDVIATLATMAKEEGIHTNILSGDKDLMQLVSGVDASPSIHMIDPMRRSRTTYKEVVEKWDVPPNRLGDVLALAGDKADNIPGVKGVGPKTAAKLINEFGSLQGVLEHAADVKQKKIRENLQKEGDQALLSRQLVELNRTVPLTALDGLPDGVTSVSELRIDPIEHDRILEFYKEMGFKALQNTFKARSTGGIAKRSSKRTTTTTRKVEIPKPEDFADVPF